MQKITISSSKKEDLIAFLIFTGFWISLFAATNTFFSGIHFQDDHQIITINKALKSTDLSSVTWNYLKNDIKIRIRPFYFIHRVFITKILGENIKYWSFYTGLLAILSSFFFYKFLKLLRFSLIESIFFSFLTLLGPQACIWWRLGPAETIGTLMLSVSLLFISKSILSPDSFAYKFLCFISISFSSLSKESFVLIIPALILIYVYFYARINNGTIKNAIKKNLLFILSLLILFILPVFLIFRTLSANKIGYAGVSNNYFSIKFLSWTIVQLYKNIYFIIIVAGVFLILQTAYVNNLKELTWHVLSTIKDKSFIFIIFLAIFLPQCFLYFKSGMEARYFIPFALGFSLLSICLLHIINTSSTVSYFSKFSFITLIVFGVFYLNFKMVVPSAIEFTDEGYQTKTFINNILKNTEKPDKILFVLNPGSEYEWGFFLKEFFETDLNRSNFQFLTISSNYSYAPNYISRDLFMNKFSKYIVNKETLSNEKYSCIAVLPLSKDLFISEFPVFSKSSDYTLLSNSNFSVYYLRKKDE